jgi:hypothetical protein
LLLHHHINTSRLNLVQIFCGLAWLASLLPKAWTFGAEAAAAQFKDHLLVRIGALFFADAVLTKHSSLSLSV